MQKTELLKKLKDEVADLKESPLYDIRKNNDWLPVIGEGSHNAKIVLVGEAPGKNEAEQGRPFCGASGRVLDELLKYAGLNRTGVYITNIVKDRPPKNRDPRPEEIKIYAPFLDRQINIIKPKIIITLGRFSSAYIMNRFGLEKIFTSMGEVHGKVFTFEAEYGEVKIVPMYHPAAALYGSGTKKLMEKDFKNVRSILKGGVIK